MPKSTLPATPTRLAEPSTGHARALRGVLAILCVLVVILPAASAQATLALRITGAGFGHGVGLSQYGALGYALHGYDYRAILAHYFTGTALGTLKTPFWVRVLLQSAPTITFAGASNAGGVALHPGLTYTAAPAAHGVQLRDHNGRPIRDLPLPLTVGGPGALRVGGTAANGVTDGGYRGALELSGSPSGLQAVNAVELEDYVRGVVSAESPGSWPLAALQAQAIAARTYAITTDVHGAGFSQYADTRSQMYRGVAAELPGSDRAVATTGGQVVTYSGRPVATFFFSSSGGRTEEPQFSSLGTGPQPWLKSVEDPYDALSPDHRWTPAILDGASAEAKLSGLLKGGLLGIEIVRRGRSPRVVAADIVGTAGRTRISGSTLRARFGLRDTWASFLAVSTNVTGPTAKVAAARRLDPSAANPFGGSAGATVGVARLVGGVIPGHAGEALGVERRLGGRWRGYLESVLVAGGGFDATVYEPGTYRVRLGGLHGPPVTVAPRRPGA